MIRPRFRRACPGSRIRAPTKTVWSDPRLMDGRTRSHDSARRLALAAAAACLAFGVGCYHYAPVPVDALAPAMTVKLELSAVAVDRLRHGPDSVARLVDGFTLSGTVARLNADSVVVSVPTSYMEANVRLKTQLHEVALLRTDIQRVSQRRLDRARTTWVSAGVGAVAVASTVAVLNGGGKSKGSTPKPVDPPESRAPVVPSLAAP